MKISVSSTFSPLSQNCLNGDQKRANSTDQSHEPRYLGHQAAYLRQCTYSHTPTAYRNHAGTPPYSTTDVRGNPASPNSRDEKSGRGLGMNKSSNVRARRGSV